MHIVADENIPYVTQAFGAFGTIELVSGRDITSAHVRSADVLLVRSVTRVDEELLGDAAVRFVGSATIGTDHIDLEYLSAEGITFAHAPGANASSVVEYVLAALLQLCVDWDVALPSLQVAVVGCGTIGQQLADRLQAMGVAVLRNDPPRARAEPDGGFVSLTRCLQEADVVSLHVPLTHGGEDATHHLIGRDELEIMKPSAWLINTSRGAVVDNEALLRARHKGRPGAVILDVWENEPTPLSALLGQCAIGTPHIAGYSTDGKVRGTKMLYEALCNEMGEPLRWTTEQALGGATPELSLATPGDTRSLEEYLHGLTEQMYPILQDDRRMRAYLQQPSTRRASLFRQLRKEYPGRRSFDRFAINESAVPEDFRRAAASGLGIRLT